MTTISFEQLAINNISDMIEEITNTYPDISVVATLVNKDEATSIVNTDTAESLSILTQTALGCMTDAGSSTNAGLVTLILGLLTCMDKEDTSSYTEVLNQIHKLIGSSDFAKVYVESAQ